MAPVLVVNEIFQTEWPTRQQSQIMLLLNQHADYRAPLDAADADTLSVVAARQVERFLRYRNGHKETPLISLTGLAREIGVGAIYLKDESHRLGLGSFKALGGSYAVIRLVLEEASRQFGRDVDVSELHTVEVKSVAGGMTVSCATDGNHGRSVAYGAKLVGAKCAIFTVEDRDAINAMKRLASPTNGDPTVVAGESGGVGLAALLKAASDPALRDTIGIGSTHGSS
ncbi:threonine dehydratase [Bradyrhizobium sp. RT9b]